MNSSKSVAEKLNFQKYPTKLIMNIPEGFVEFKELEFDSRIEKDKYNMIFQIEDKLPSESGVCR